MTTVFVSNNDCSSPLPMPSVDAVAYSVADRYDLYEAAVTDAGGTIVDPADTLSVMQYLRDNLLEGRLAAMVSPSWGVKASAGLADMLFGIEGPDFEGLAMGVGGAKPTLTTDAAGNPIAVTALNASSVGGIFRSVTDLTLADDANEWCAIVASISGVSGGTAEIGFGNLPSGGTGFACAALTRTAALNGYVAQKSGYAPNSATDGTKRMTSNLTNTGRADTETTALALNISTGTVQVIANGTAFTPAVSDLPALPALPKLTDYTTLARRLYIGSDYNGSATISRPRNGQFRHLMALKRTNIDELRKITSDFSARYA